MFILCGLRFSTRNRESSLTPLQRSPKGMLRDGMVLGENEMNNLLQLFAVDDDLNGFSRKFREELSDYSRLCHYLHQKCGQLLKSVTEFMAGWKTDCHFHGKCGRTRFRLTNTRFDNTINIQRCFSG